MIEVLDDIIEELANKCGVYGSHVEAEERECRCCWTSRLRARIDHAVEVERKLEATNA